MKWLLILLMLFVGCGEPQTEQEREFYSRMVEQRKIERDKEWLRNGQAFTKISKDFNKRSCDHE